MFAIVAWLRCRARTMPNRSPRSSVMPALSMATSVPEPIDADVGGGERGSVVDPVACHGDDPALLAQPLDDRALLVGEDIGFRSEERRVGKEWVSKCRIRGSPYT